MYPTIKFKYVTLKNLCTVYYFNAFNITYGNARLSFPIDPVQAVISRLDFSKVRKSDCEPLRFALGLEMHLEIDLFTGVVGQPVQRDVPGGVKRDVENFSSGQRHHKN